MSVPKSRARRRLEFFDCARGKLHGTAGTFCNDWNLPKGLRARSEFIEGASGADLEIIDHFPFVQLVEALRNIFPPSMATSKSASQVYRAVCSRRHTGVKLERDMSFQPVGCQRSSVLGCRFAEPRSFSFIPCLYLFFAITSHDHELRARSFPVIPLPLSSRVRLTM